MKTKEFKIKGTYSIDYPKNVNLYRESETGVISISDDINIKLGDNDFHIDKIVSIEKFKPTQLNFEPWLKLKFMASGMEQTLYLCSNKFLGLDNLISKSRLKKIERILSERVSK